MKRLFALSLQEADTTLVVIATYAPPAQHERFLKTVAGLGHDYGYKNVPMLQWLVSGCRNTSPAQRTVCDFDAVPQVGSHRGWTCVEAIENYAYRKESDLLNDHR